MILDRLFLTYVMVANAEGGVVETAELGIGILAIAHNTKPPPVSHKIMMHMNHEQSQL